MSKFKASAMGAIFLGMSAWLFVEHRAGTRLNSEILSLKAEVQQLVEGLASLQQDFTNLPPSTIDSIHLPPSENQPAELLRLRAEVGHLRDRVAQMEQASAALSNQIASSTGANEPFIYPDSKRKKDYAFSGYAAPQAALQSVLWALSQSDGKAFQASLAPEMAKGFSDQFQDLPEGVMPGGFKNGAMYQASGYRVLEETPISNEETRLKVFLEGKPKLAIKLVFKRVGNEWKWARNE